MNCQLKTFLTITLISTIIFFNEAYANNSDWANLASAKIEIQPYSSAQGQVISSYIPYFREIGHLLFNWEPDKQPKNGSDLVLLPEQNKISGLMKNLFIDFDVSNTKHFRKVWFKFSETVKFRGLFGLHDFTKKRPFIILRMGIHGNIDELLAEKFLAKLIYEDLDANFLILESLTSHAFILNNKNISFGGVDEGLQTFLVLEQLKSKLKNVTLSTHLMAISLGGQGTFVTAMLDSANNKNIKSILNFCPLINLQDTFSEHTKPEANFKNALIDLWNRRRLGAVFNNYTGDEGLSQWYETLFDFKPRFTRALLDILNRERKAPLITAAEIDGQVPNMQWPLGFKNHLESSKSFFELNNFWLYYKNIKTPIMIYTTPSDPLVMNYLNSEKIFKGVQTGDFTSLKYNRLSKGVHCGLASVYQWPYIVKIVKEGLEL